MSVNALKIHRAELTQAELTQVRVDFEADLTSGRVDPLPIASTSAQGGGTLNFSTYVGSGPASTLHPPKISGISITPPPPKFF